MIGYEGYINFGGVVLPLVNWQISPSREFQKRMAEVRTQLYGFLTNPAPVEVTIDYQPILQGRPILWWYKMLAETPRG